MQANIANAASGIIGIYIQTLEPLVISRFLNTFENLQTSSCNCLKEYDLESPGSSPSQIKAVFSDLSSRCLSRQFSLTFIFPFLNHSVFANLLL